MFGGPPLGAQSDPKGRPRSPQGRPKVTFWSPLDHFWTLFEKFWSLLDTFLVTFAHVWQLFGVKALSSICCTFLSQIVQKMIVGRQFRISIFAKNHRVLPYELDVALFG